MMLEGSAIATIVAALIALGAAIYAGRAARRNRREQEDYASRTPSPPTTQEVWTRLDTVERKMQALVRIVHDTAEQWPETAPPPTFSPTDLAILEDTMPAAWRRPPRRSRA